MCIIKDDLKMIKDIKNTANVMSNFTYPHIVLYVQIMIERFWILQINVL